MARKALVFWLLQFLPFIATANADSNATSHNCTDVDMANVEALVSALHAVEDAKIDADDGGEKLQPFGSLKSDWSKLHLLQKALPEDSVLKHKFKHIFRLLAVAHDEATRVLISSESTKIRHESVSRSTISLIFNTSTTPISGFTQNITDPNTTSRTSNLSTLSPVCRDDGADAVVMRNISDMSAQIDKEKEITVTVNTTDVEPTIQSLVTTPALNPTLEPLMKFSTIVAAPNLTLDSGMKPSITTAASIPTLEFRDPSTASSILIPVSPVSEGEIKSSTSTRKELGQTSKMLPWKSTATEKEKHWTEKNTEQYSTRTTEKISKYVPTESSTREEYSSIGTTTNVGSLNLTSSKNDSLSPTDETRINYSPQSAITVNPAEQLSTTAEYSSTTPHSNVVPTKNQSVFSVTSDQLLTSSTQKPENISWVLSTPSTLLTKNFTADLENRETTTSSSAKMTNTDNITVVSPATKENEEIELKSSNNRTENSLGVNLTPSLWRTTDFAENVLNVTSTTAIDRNIGLTTVKNQNEVSTDESSTADARETSNSTEKVSSVTPSISVNEKLSSTRQDNQTENPMNKKSTVNGWVITVPTGSIQTTIPSIEVNKDSKSTSKNNETTVSTSEKSIPGDKDELSMPKSTSVSSASKLSTNSTKLVTATGVTISSDKMTDNSAPIESSTNAKGTETSTRNYVADQSTVPAVRNKLNISKDSEMKAKTEMPKAQITSDENSVNNSQPSLEINSKELKDDLDNSAPVTTTSELSSDSPSWLINSKPNLAAKASTEMPKSQSTAEQNPTTSRTKLEMTSKEPKDNLGNLATVATISELSSHSQSWYINTKPNFATKTRTEMPKVQSTTEQNPTTSRTKLEMTSKEPKDDRGNIATVATISELSSHSQSWYINTKPNFATKIRTEMPKVQSTTEKSPATSQLNFEMTSEGPKDNRDNPTSVTESSRSQNWPTKPKPMFKKNPLNVGSSRGNSIVLQYKHGSANSGTAKNSESPQIILPEVGTGPKTAPAGNNSWLFGGFPNHGGPHGYGYGQSAPAANGKADIGNDAKSPAKFSALGRRTNMLRSRKRGSANADVEKQFRSFYLQHKPRVKANDNARINIQCKKPQHPH